MALPKKRTPKSRRNSRRSVWFHKAFEKGKKALAFSKSWAPPEFDAPSPQLEKSESNKVQSEIED